MGIVLVVLIGLGAGLIARALMAERAVVGWTSTVALGIAGSFVGEFLATAARVDDTVRISYFQRASLIGSLIGALVVLGIFLWPSRRGEEMSGPD
jgi:uncharacterized membrane protein YeaQ/YmgE (transglycosylase-associated protein family)